MTLQYFRNNKNMRLLKGSPLFKENLHRLAEIYEVTKDISDAITVFMARYPKFKKNKGYVHLMAETLIDMLGVEGKTKAILAEDMESYNQILEIAKLLIYERPSPKAIEACLKVIESRQKALNITKPSSINVNTGDTNNTVNLNLGKLRKEEILKRLPPDLKELFVRITNKQLTDNSKVLNMPAQELIVNE
jgi:hypothetical protein